MVLNVWQEAPQERGFLETGITQRLVSETSEIQSCWRSGTSGLGVSSRERQRPRPGGEHGHARLQPTRAGQMHGSSTPSGGAQRQLGRVPRAGGTMVGQPTVTGRAKIQRRVVGWREWVALPALGIESIKAKFDTGARTSALHVWDQEVYEVEGKRWVRFSTHPVQRDDDTVVHCAALLVDRRWVRNSGGNRECRNVISTLLGIGGETWEAELTLASRDAMGFRMLVGREAMRGRLVVDPAQSFRTGYRARRTRGRRPDPGG